FNEHGFASNTENAILWASGALNLANALAGFVSAGFQIFRPHQEILIKLFGGLSTGTYTLSQLIQGINSLTVIARWVAKGAPGEHRPTPEILSAIKTLVTILGATALTVGQAYTIPTSVIAAAVTGQALGAIGGGASIHIAKKIALGKQD